MYNHISSTRWYHLESIHLFKAITWNAHTQHIRYTLLQWVWLTQQFCSLSNCLRSIVFNEIDFAMLICVRVRGFVCNPFWAATHFSRLSVFSIPPETICSFGIFRNGDNHHMDVDCYSSVYDQPFRHAQYIPNKTGAIKSQIKTNFRMCVDAGEQWICILLGKICWVYFSQPRPIQR